jgi:hypothetical protein
MHGKGRALFGAVPVSVCLAFWSHLIEQGAEGVRERERCGTVGSHDRNTTPIPAVEAEKKTVTICLSFISEKYERR